MIKAGIELRSSGPLPRSSMNECCLCTNDDGRKIILLKILIHITTTKLSICSSSGSAVEHSIDDLEVEV